MNWSLFRGRLCWREMLHDLNSTSSLPTVTVVSTTSTRPLSKSTSPVFHNIPAFFRSYCTLKFKHCLSLQSNSCRTLQHFQTSTTPTAKIRTPSNNKPQPDSTTMPPSTPTTLNNNPVPPVSSPKATSRNYQPSPTIMRRMKTATQSVQLHRKEKVSRKVLDCVVKIFVTCCRPDFSLPWAMQNQETYTASGFLIKDKRIVTNAHVVAFSKSILIKRRGSDEKFTAQVLAVSHEADLALLTVADDHFWQPHQDDGTLINGNEENGNLEHGPENGNAVNDGDENNYEKEEDFPYFPLKPQSLPNLQDSVTVIGYPCGGENVSVTAGIVSRIEIQEYQFGKTCLLAAQIDAAINRGNSGGCVLDQDCQLIGVAHQSYDSGYLELVGYFIPRMVLDQFLMDYEKNGRCTGISTCSFQYQNIGSEALRRAYKMPNPKRARGILVKAVDKTSDAFNVLEKGDIVTNCDGVEISDQGTVPFMQGERVGFNFLITRKHVGEAVSLTIVREGKVVDVNYKLSAVAESRLVRTHELRRQPEYLVIGGLTFSALTFPFIDDVFGGLEYTPTRIRQKLFCEKESHDHEIVVLSGVLNAKVNFGYQELGVVIIQKVNETKVVTLKQLAETVAACTDEFLYFEMDDNETIILDRKEAHSANEEILKQYRIPSASSIGPLSD